MSCVFMINFLQNYNNFQNEVNFFRIFASRIDKKLSYEIRVR